MTIDSDRNLWEDLHAFLLGNGASVVGCGSMSQVADSKRDGYPIGISIGVALEPSLIEGLLDGPSEALRENGASVRASLVRLRHSCVEFLIERGHQACFSRSGITDEANFISDLPHKTVATRAGLGWIGKSALLISEDFGGALRLTSVLTDAPYRSRGRSIRRAAVHAKRAWSTAPGRPSSGRNGKSGWIARACSSLKCATKPERSARGQQVWATQGSATYALLCVHGHRASQKERRANNRMQRTRRSAPLMRDVR